MYLMQGLRPPGNLQHVVGGKLLTLIQGWFMNSVMLILWLGSVFSRWRISCWAGTHNTGRGNQGVHLSVCTPHLHHHQCLMVLYTYSPAVSSTFFRHVRPLWVGELVLPVADALLHPWRYGQAVVRVEGGVSTKSGDRYGVEWRISNMH